MLSDLRDLESLLLLQLLLSMLELLLAVNEVPLLGLVELLQLVRSPTADLDRGVVVNDVDVRLLTIPLFRRSLVLIGHLLLRLLLLRLQSGYQLQLLGIQIIE